jgi:hypothetical protein
MLAAMIAEVKSAPALCGSGGESTDCPLEFFDYGATVSDDAVVPDGRSVEKYFGESRVIFHRMIAADNDLAAALAKELRLRGVCPGGECGMSNVAVVSEWDTFYGRNLPQTIAAAFCPSRPLEQCGFERFSYLRGLDGQLPNDEAASAMKSGATNKPRRKEGDTRNDDQTSSDTAKRLERPEGQGQFDYLRRLAGRIQRRDEELRKRGEGRIAAIGVLGTDVYDKLLVLRALRPAFPAALFFTTDLDARFSDGGEIAATRNLLVASGFDLELRREIQKDIPPFRDSYQTAAFLATQTAVGNGAAQCRDCKNASRYAAGVLEAAHVFQIGRTGAFELAGDGGTSPPRQLTIDDPCEKNLLACSTTHVTPRLFPQLPEGALPRVGAALLAGLLLAGMSVGCMVIGGAFRQAARHAGACERWVGAEGARDAMAVALAIATFFAGGAIGGYWNDIAGWLTQYGDGEPMMLSEGISVWPTIILRALSVVLCLALIFHSLNRLDGNIDAIAVALRLDHLRHVIIEAQAKVDRQRSWWSRLRDVFSRHLQERGPYSIEEQEQWPVVNFWRSYVYRGRKSARVLRVTVCVLTMIAFGTVLSLVFGSPNDPARDPATRQLYTVITLADVVATQFLIFLVADATVFSCLFVRALRRNRSVWPDGSRRAFAALLGIEGAAVDEWINTQFVAMRTQCIINLIYLPFVMIALLIVSRSSVIDSFAGSQTLVLLHCTSLAVVGGCVLWLRWEAEQARQTAVCNLNHALIEMARDDSGGNEGVSTPRSRVENLIGRVEKLQEGAFAPLTRQPLVRALLLPLGSYGGTAFLEYFAPGGL